MRRHLGLRVPDRCALVLLAFVAAFVFSIPSAARAAEATPQELQAARARALKDLQIRLAMRGARHEKAEKREKAFESLEAQRAGRPAPSGADRAKQPIDDDGALQRAVSALRRAAPAALSATAVIPANVMANDRSGDVLPASGQAESSIAVLGQNILVAWNDGDGFGGGSQAPHVQGYGYSTNGGATFTDGMTFPIPMGSPNWVWASDPVVTVNEKTGDFYYCGLVDPTSITNGIGVVKGTFVGNALNWSPPVAALSVSSFTNFTDKQWIAADSSNGNLYLSWTDFFSAGDAIRFSRSIDGGLTWSTPIQISSGAANGLVQGSRPVVGPDGEVYVVWKELNPVGGTPDFIKIRKSTNAGASFGAAITTVASAYDNFGTGAPGFNRERAVSFPSIAVDRTHGPNRGRVHVAFHESYNFYDDFLGGGANVIETEGNNTSATANPFVPGDVIRGTQTTNDQDWFRFNAVAGNQYMFWCDSIPNQYYSFRVFCTDGVQRLALSAALPNSANPGDDSFMTWTAPTTGTYYLRLFWVSGAGTGGYHIFTGVGAHGTERGRDQRDVFATYSDGGASWSSPVRVNDEPALYDDWLPEIIVGGDGCPYAMWFDWRDDAVTCAGQSHIYVSRSTDGGATWQSNRRATNVASDWSGTGSNIAPNQGDYSHMASDDRHVFWTWADARSGDPDVFTAGLDIRHSLTVCKSDTTVTPNDTFSAHFEVSNPNALFANNYTYTLTDERGWTLPTGNAGAAAASAGAIEPTISVPDTAAAGDNQICLNVTNEKGTRTEQCCFTVTVSANVGVEDNPVAFGLRAIAPNPAIGPARIAFTLPSNGAVSLRIYGLRGERVRSLADGEWTAGLHTVVWDGLDDRGNPVRPGAYFVRLEGLGQSAVRRFVKVQ